MTAENQAPEGELRTAALQAIAALERTAHTTDAERFAAADALRAALAAQPAAAVQAPAEGDDILEPLIYAAMMHNGKPKTVAEFERAAANVADMLQRRAEVTHNKPVASIYISDDGSREFDDWRVDLPPGNHQLFTAPRPDQPQPESLPHPGAPEAEEMIEKLLAECNRPSNMKNAARAGYMAAKRLLDSLSAIPSPAVRTEPLSPDQLQTLWSPYAGAAPFSYARAIERAHGIGTGTGVQQATAVAPSPAASDVLAERQRQIEREGYTRQFDADMHDSNDLARAAAFYAMAEVGYEYGRVAWPWDEEGCKVKDRYRNFVRAAALLIAAADVERARSGVSDVPVQHLGQS